MKECRRRQGHCHYRDVWGAPAWTCSPVFTYNYLSLPNKETQTREQIGVSALLTFKSNWVRWNLNKTKSLLWRLCFFLFHVQKQAQHKGRNMRNVCWESVASLENLPKLQMGDTAHPEAAPQNLKQDQDLGLLGFHIKAIWKIWWYTVGLLSLFILQIYRSGQCSWYKTTICARFLNKGNTVKHLYINTSLELFNTSESL